MDKLDFKKALPEYFNVSKSDFSVVTIPRLQFLQIDGSGNPNMAPEYSQALEALYSLAYKLKFQSKNELGRDYAVPPLEGLWWADDMAAFTGGEKDSWKWTMMLMTPDWITPDLVEEVRIQVAAGKNPEALPGVRLAEYEEGLCVQILHLGSYDDEAPTLRRLHEEYLPQQGFEPGGLHHEIYLNSPTRVAAEKLRTILRQPVRKAGRR